MQGISSKLNEFECFLIDSNFEFDFICVSEHWLNNDELWDGLPLARWRVATYFARKGHIRGGVLIFAKKEVPCVALEFINSLSCEINCEIVSVLCKLSNVVIVCIYRSPSGDFEEFFNLLTQTLELLKSYRKVVLVGDYNVRFGTTEVRAVRVTDLLLSYGFMMTIHRATRGENCLDNIFINFSHGEFKASVIDTRLSDHLAQAVSVVAGGVSGNGYELRMTRPITAVGIYNFFNVFSGVDLNFLDDFTLGGNARFELFHGAFMLCFQRCFPERQQLTRNRDLGIGWFNDSLRHHRNRYSFICELYNAHKTTALLNLKKQSRCNYNKAITEAKVEASSNYIRNSYNKSKASWDVVRSIRGTNKISPSQVDPDTLNKYFVEHPLGIIRGLPAAADSPLDLCVVPSGAAVGFSLSGVSAVEVRDILKSLKHSTTKDIYGISTRFIKTNISLYVPHLTKLINSTINTGEFPDLLKCACVIPIHKSGCLSDAANYRPISILPVFSKVYERAMYRQIAGHFEFHGLFSPDQFGFRKGRRTEDVVVGLANSCLDAFDGGEFCFTLLLDLSRAFDCVSHSILLEKLEHIYKFSEITIKTIKSYLINRNQRVANGRGRSEPLSVSRGVAQGSIIGPLMFLIFFNDFSFFIKQGHDVECFLYADDATITIRSKSFDDGLLKSNEVLAAAKRWALANELSLNEDKTEKLVFGLRRFAFDNPTKAKLLGVHIAPPALGFGEHANVIGSKMCRSIFLLRRLATSVTQDVLRSAYFALIQSHIKYCILAWGGSPASDYIFKLQRRAVRVVGGLGYRDDCREVFLRHNILTVPCEFILSCVMYINANRHALSANRDFHSYETRGRDDIRPDFCRLTRTQRGCWRVSVSLYNKLPPTWKDLSNCMLRTRVKDFLLRHAYYSVQEFLNCSNVVL